MPDLALIQAAPAASANGSSLPNQPANARGVRLYFVGSGAVSYTIASAQPASAPSPVFAASQATVGSYVLDEPLLPGQNLYVTALTGTVYFRWLFGG